MRGWRRVVRLKSGDPMIFGRAGEEIAACREAGINVEVVPGISAAQGAASRLLLSLTHRKLARRVQYITAHGANGRLPADIDWASLGHPSTTTVVYMPKRSLAELCERSRSPRRRGRNRKSSRARSPTSRVGSRQHLPMARCW